MSVGQRGSTRSLAKVSRGDRSVSDRSSVRSLGTTQYDEEAHQQGSASNALGGFGLLLRQGVSQRLETQGQTIFFVARVEKGGPAYAAGMRVDDTLESVDGGKREMREGGRDVRRLRLLCETQAFNGGWFAATSARCA